MTSLAKALPAFESKKSVSVLEMLLGNLLSAAAFGLFILPEGFASAGVTGLSSFLCQYLPLSLSLLVFVINVLCLGIGLVGIGKEFTMKSVASSLIFPCLLQCFSWLNIQPINSPVLGVFLAGLFLGAGTGLLLRSGSSSGGFSILAVLFQKKWKIPASLTLALCDATIILLQTRTNSLLNTLCGILVVFISAFVVSKIADSQNSSKAHSEYSKLQ